jgi:integral membrane protein
MDTMPQPKLATFPAIRSALRLYQICSVVTGTMLLLLVAEMVVKYGFHHELFVGGSGGFMWWAPVTELGESTGDGFNVSMFILIAHGWFYVVYLFSCFRVWSLMRWPFLRFLLLALGGVVPFLSFFLEASVARSVRRYLAEREAAEAAAVPAATTLPQTSDLS